MSHVPRRDDARSPPCWLQPCEGSAYTLHQNSLLLALRPPADQWKKKTLSAVLEGSMVNDTVQNLVQKGFEAFMKSWGFVHCSAPEKVPSRWGYFDVLRRDFLFPCPVCYIVRSDHWTSWR